MIVTYACVKNTNLCDNCIVNRRAGVSENDTSSNGDVKICFFFFIKTVVTLMPYSSILVEIKFTITNTIYYYYYYHYHYYYYIQFHMFISYFLIISKEFIQSGSP